MSLFKAFALIYSSDNWYMLGFNNDQWQLLGGTIEPDFDVREDLYSMIEFQTSSFILKSDIQSSYCMEILDLGKSITIFPYEVELKAEFLRGLNIDLSNPDNTIYIGSSDNLLVGFFNFSEINRLIEGNKVRGYRLREFDRDILRSCLYQKQNFENEIRERECEMSQWKNYSMERCSRSPFRKV